MINPLAPANISDCGLYRYSLYREVNPNAKTIYAFIGVNPSTADASENDQTIKKMIGFVNKWGGKGFIVVNVFAYRNKDVKQLAKIDDPCGSYNNEHIQAVLSSADVIVPCWGNRKKLRVRFHPLLDNMLDILKSFNDKTKALGLTLSGDPLHPLTVAYKTPLISLRTSNEKG